MPTGYLQVYTGDGKGKTTAALGLALRAAGAGKKVLIVQFAKAKKCSEHIILEQLSGNITVRRYGTGVFIDGLPSAADIEEARRGMADASEAINAGEYDVVVLDEACFAVSANLFSDSDLLRALQKRGDGVEVVVTGRNASAKLIEAADLVTEMKKVKHYFDAGVGARKGIEE